MAADVQGWLDNPASDFGWILVGNEVDTRSAKRFDSLQHDTEVLRPLLTIDYTAPAITGGCCSEAATSAAHSSSTSTTSMQASCGP